MGFVCLVTLVFFGKLKKRYDPCRPTCNITQSVLCKVTSLTNVNQLILRQQCDNLLKCKIINHCNNYFVYLYYVIIILLLHFYFIIVLFIPLYTLIDHHVLINFISLICSGPF